MRGLWVVGGFVGGRWEFFGMLVGGCGRGG